ncbi:MAG: hypothetical protein JNM63_19410 [Spirochaetia bacterium]|nr:hypothetical protein [Spirochaetia bacterium]
MLTTNAFATAVTNAAGSNSYFLIAGSNSLVTLQYYSFDPAGNVSATNSRIYTLDMSPPLVSVAPGTSCSTNAPFVASLDVSGNSGWWSTNGGSTWSSFSTNGTALAISNTTTLLTFGREVLSGSGVTYSNTSATNALTWTFGTAPSAPVVTGAPASFTTNASFSISLAVNSNFGYWSTNGPASFNAFTAAGTNLLIAGTTTLYTYGAANGVASATNSNTYLFQPLETLAIEKLAILQDPVKGTAWISYVVDVGSGSTAALKFFYRASDSNNFTPFKTGSVQGQVTFSKNGTYSNEWQVPELEAGKKYSIRAALSLSQEREVSVVWENVGFEKYFRRSETLAGAVLLNHPFRGEADGMILVNIPQDTQAQIVSLTGRKIADLPHPDSRGRISWKGRDERGKTVPPGVYLMYLRCAAGDKILKIIIFQP